MRLAAARIGRRDKAGIGGQILRVAEVADLKEAQDAWPLGRTEDRFAVDGLRSG